MDAFGNIKKRISLLGHNDKEFRSTREIVHRACFFRNLEFCKIFGAKNFFIVAVSAIFLFALGGCRSTKFADDQTQILSDGLEINAHDEVFKIYDTDFKDEFSEGEKFIFLRLYFPNYKNKLSGVNILKGLIASVDPSDYDFSHTAIGFDLHDDFYGLTRYKPQDLKHESCLNTETNIYMKMCDKYKSLQMTLAIKVSAEEYEATKKFLERDYAEAKVKYFIPKNLPLGFWGVKRKSQKNAEARSFGGIPSKNGYVDPTEEERFKFVCSSYIAYVLANTVQNVRDFFIEKEIDYNYVIPTDLIFFPGAQKCFLSTWADYEIAAEEFVKSSPLFEEYLK